MKPSISMRHKDNIGFTLVECLIGIGIIVVLTALLAPVLNRSLEASRSTKCVHQLKTLYHAIQLYLQDHRQEFPAAYPPLPVDVPWQGTWAGAWDRPTTNPNDGLPRYFAGGRDELSQMSVCPKNRLKDPRPSSLHNPFGFSYLCNYEVMTQNGGKRPPAKSSAFILSQTVLLADAAAGPDWGLGLAAGNVGTAAWKRLAQRHGGYANILWADGHVSSERKSNLTRAHFELKGL